MSKHWTAKLKEENAELKAIVEHMLTEQRRVIQTRYDKYKGVNTNDALHYRKAVQEISNRLDDLSSVVNDRLWEASQ